MAVSVFFKAAPSRMVKLPIRLGIPSGSFALRLAIETLTTASPLSAPKTS
jgi:hypothetical protein